jgi:K+-sensing histidine kinase KdpD
MGKLTSLRKWFPVIWVGLATAILVGDYFTGPLISFSILFLVPVALAARLSGRWWGIALGALMPLAHLGFTFLWNAPWTLADSMVNAGIRMAVLMAFAVLIDRVTRQAREIRVLRGLLPVCAFCKKIRTEDQNWRPIESYITEHSQASFTHTFCPECAKQHYGEYFDQIKARLPGDQQGAPQ